MKSPILFFHAGKRVPNPVVIWRVKDKIFALLQSLSIRLETAFCTQLEKRHPHASTTIPVSALPSSKLTSDFLQNKILSNLTHLPPPEVPHPQLFKNSNMFAEFSSFSKFFCSIFALSSFSDFSSFGTCPEMPSVVPWPRFSCPLGRPVPINVSSSMGFTTLK